MVIVDRMRQLLQGDDLARARTEETKLLREERRRREELPRQLAAAYSSVAPNAWELGTIVGTAQPVRLPPERLGGHWSLVGPSGAGKSFLLSLIVMAWLAAGLRRFFLADAKNETVDLVLRGLLEFAKRLPPPAAEEFLSRVALIDIFSSRLLPQLNVLAAEPGLDPEQQSFELASLLRATGAYLTGTAHRQDASWYPLLQAMILGGLAFPAAPAVLREPRILDGLAERGIAPEFMRATAARLKEESRDRIMGLINRAEAVLRLRSVRLALSAPGCLDLDRALDQKLVLMPLGPEGSNSDDTATFPRGSIWKMLSRSIRRRANGAPPALLALEEFPAFLSLAGPNADEDCESLLRLSRAKGITMALLSQDLISVAKISPSLPLVMRNNCSWQAIFRTQDSWDSVLPVTGFRPQPRGSLWDRPTSPYLSAASERELLRTELSRLPNRTLYLLDQRLGLPAVLMRTKEVRFSVTDAEVAAFKEQVRRNDLVSSIGALERAERDLAERLEMLRGRSPTAAATRGGAAATQRRGTRPVEMG